MMDTGGPESVFFKAAVLSITFQWMAPYLCVYRQHKLDSEAYNK